MRDALCVEHDDVAFFIEHGEDPRPAKSICGRCAVRAECLDYALQHHIDFGIWGGTSGRERANLRRTMTTPLDSHGNATRRAH